MPFVHRRRPGRAEVDPAALELIARHGPQILATARRYSATPEDAEDAYQRGLEILLTKAPATAEEELVPWLKTVVKHEAFAIRRQRERQTPVSDEGELAEPPSSDAATHDQAERLERLSHGAEAMRRLKPQEIRCLLLKAEGYSYKETSVPLLAGASSVPRCKGTRRKTGEKPSVTPSSISALGAATTNQVASSPTAMVETPSSPRAATTSPWCGDWSIGSSARAM